MPVALSLGLCPKGKVSEMGHATSSSMEGRRRSVITVYRLFNLVNSIWTVLI